MARGAAASNLGRPEQTDSGRQFVIHAVLAEPQGSQSFSDYLAQVARQRQFPGMDRLPLAAYPIAQVTVVRK
jgi:hypothetical protein